MQFLGSSIRFQIFTWSSSPIGWWMAWILVWWCLIQHPLATPWDCWPSRQLLRTLSERSLAWKTALDRLFLRWCTFMEGYSNYQQNVFFFLVFFPLLFFSLHSNIALWELRLSHGLHVTQILRLIYRESLNSQPLFGSFPWPTPEKMTSLSGGTGNEPKSGWDNIEAQILRQVVRQYSTPLWTIYMQWGPITAD